MTSSNSIFSLLDLHMRCDIFLLVILIELFVDGCSNLIRLLFILKHCLR
jgi:hypothetical protein